MINGCHDSDTVQLTSRLLSIQNQDESHVLSDVESEKEFIKQLNHESESNEAVSRQNINIESVKHESEESPENHGPGLIKVESDEEPHTIQSNCEFDGIVQNIKIESIRSEQSLVFKGPEITVLEHETETRLQENHESGCVDTLSQNLKIDSEQDDSEVSLEQRQEPEVINLESEQESEIIDGESEQESINCESRNGEKTLVKYFF